MEGIRQAPLKYTVGERTGRGGEGCEYATRRWAPKGKRARGWYKLYRSIDLLSEETLRCHYYCEETHAAIAAVAIAIPLLPPLLLLLLLPVLLLLLLLCGLLGCIVERTLEQHAYKRTGARVSARACIRLTCVREGKGLSRIRGRYEGRRRYPLKGSALSLSSSLFPFLLSLSRWIERGLRWSWTTLACIIARTCNDDRPCIEAAPLGVRNRAAFIVCLYILPGERK